MRGAPGHVDLVCELVGIIPAYAGSTCSSTRWTACTRDHPRVCGEHTPTQGVICAFTGSSPRMRGALLIRAGLAFQPGIIPAYAGSTSSRRRCRRAPRDHPRVCGEHSVALLPSRSFQGSSPRMRGARALRHGGRVPEGSSPRMRGAHRRGGVRGDGRGIIPAYAGSTAPCRRTRWWRGDHPRVCGEHCSTTPILLTFPGSSPRMRGALVTVALAV